MADIKNILANELGIVPDTNIPKDITNGAKKILNLSSNTLIVIYIILSIICMISYGFLTDVSGTTLTGVYVGCVLACLGIIIAGILRIMYSDNPKAKSILNVIFIILFLFQTGLNITMIALVSTSPEAGRLTKNMKFVLYLSGIAPLIIAPPMIYSFYNSSKYLEKLEGYVKTCDKPASVSAQVASSVPVVVPSASSASSQLLAQAANQQVLQDAKDAECKIFADAAKAINPLTQEKYENLVKAQAHTKNIPPYIYSAEAAACLHKHGIKKQVSEDFKPFIPPTPPPNLPASY